MTTLENIRQNSTLKDVFEGQLLHIGLIILMAFGAHSLLMPSFSDPTFLFWDSKDWAMFSIELAILHQVIVAIVFRGQLYFNMMTRLFGDNDMHVWRMIFLPLLLARPVTLVIVGWLDPNPITGWQSMEILVGLGLVVASGLALYSVIRFFTIERALGSDHFRNDVLSMPLEDRGIFKYTSNGMYGVAFLGLWGIALMTTSWNALIVALFQHCYIWVHMYLTEGPDMRRLYPDAD